MRLYLIAGERSGDLHGGNLIKAIRKLRPEAIFRGFGGDRMEAEGMQLVVHYNQMAFMGVIQVIINLRKIFGWMRHCKSDILSWNPDAVVLIDYGGFNMRMAAFLKMYGIKTIYYISPKVWAWNTKRAIKLKASVDEMLCILPFETSFYKKFEWDVTYVGNPVLDAVRSFRPQLDFRSRNGLGSAQIIALLPGSRRIELKRMLPLMAQVAKRFPGYLFVVAAIRELPAQLYAPMSSLSNVRLIYDETYDLLCNARAAIVTSGTATLETALFRIPQVVVYKANPFEYALGSLLISVKFISLVNLIADAPVVKELLQKQATEDAVCTELEKLIDDEHYRGKIFEGYDRIFQQLDIGSASDNAANLICQSVPRF